MLVNEYYNYDFSNNMSIKIIYPDHTYIPNQNCQQFDSTKFSNAFQKEFIEKTKPSDIDDIDTDRVIFNKDITTKKSGKKNIIKKIENKIIKKYMKDNELRKTKSISLRLYIAFFNRKIDLSYKYSKKNRRLKLKNINYKKYINNADIEFNREFFYMSLRDIFYLDISPKNKDKSNNKKLFDILYNENDAKIREIFIKISNISLIYFINILVGKKECPDEFEDLELDPKKWKYMKEKDCKYILNFMENIEDVLKNTKYRNKFKKNNYF